MKTEIANELKKWCPDFQVTERLEKATSSLTSLIIKWLEEHKDYGKELDNDTIVRNQLITELIGGVR